MTNPKPIGSTEDELQQILLEEFFGGGTIDALTDGFDESVRMSAARINTMLNDAREESFLAKLAEYPILDQQKVLGGLLYKYLLEPTNATTVNIKLENFGVRDKRLGNLEIKVALKKGRG